MFVKEQYKHNIEIQDKNSINNVRTDKTIFNCPLNMIAKEMVETCSSHKPPLSAAVIGLKNTAAAMPCDAYTNYWTDLDAQEEYLNTKPTNYLVLSKPGLMVCPFAEELSKKLKCIHLSPYKVIVDEINQQSVTGKCIDLNLKNNKLLDPNHFLSIIKQKMCSPSIQHRGYVLSGLPLVTTSKEITYFIKSLYGEEAVAIVNELIDELMCEAVKKRSPKTKQILNKSSQSSLLDEIGEEEHYEENETVQVEENEDTPIVMSEFVLEPTSNIIFNKKAQISSVSAVMLNQLDQLFDLPNKPDIIIYITCPDIDIVTKNTHGFYDYNTGKHIDIPFSYNNVTDLRWPTKYSIKNFTGGKTNDYLFTSKYYCLPPYHYKTNSTNQLCNYKSCILSSLEMKLQEYDPKFVIKLDGRIPVKDMTNEVEHRLQLLQIKPVLVPQLFNFNNSELPSGYEDFWKIIDELNVLEFETFKICKEPSPWFNRCPVELKKGRTINGNIKYAVSFFKHLYLLSSYEAMVTFCNNPRPFLKLKYLLPTCRVIVLGTKSAGKTMVCQFLSWLFNATVIPFKVLTNELRQVKYDNFAKSVFKEIIGPIEDQRHNTYNNVEEKRKLDLETWLNTTFESLKNFIQISERRAKLDPKKFNREIEKIKKNLTHFPQDLLEDISYCQNIISDKENLLIYASLELTTPSEIPNVPHLEDNDVREAISAYIVANELQKEIEPSAEELVKQFINVTTAIDDRAQQINLETCYGQWVIDDFPSSPEVWSLLQDRNILPDYTISLLENREISSDIIKHYKDIDLVEKNHLPKFTYINDPLVKIKLMSSIYQPNFYDMVRDVLKEVIENVLFAKPLEEQIEEEQINAFNEAVEKYREHLDDILIRTEQNMRALIKIELQDKDDKDILEEVLLKIRKAYNITCITNDDLPLVENDVTVEDINDETCNDPKLLCETNIYCPIAYYKSNVLWEGKPEFSIKYNNKVHYFCKEECMSLFQQDPIRYQSYNLLYKSLPPLRICVTGCIGSGKSSLSQHIATELGLIHIDISDIVNELLMPRHFKKVGRKYENPFTDIPIESDEVSEMRLTEETEINELDIIKNEAELRRVVYNYFELGTPLPTKLVENVLRKIWNENPYSKTGFVLDGFPCLPNDVESMTTCFCVPDIVIEIESSSDLSNNRIVTAMFRKWKVQLNEAKRIAKEIFNARHNEWKNAIAQKIIIQLTIDDLLDNVIILTGQFVPEPSTGSLLLDVQKSGSMVVDMKLIKLYHETIESTPEPIDVREWEHPDEVLEKIENRIESIFEVNDSNIQTMKDVLAEQRIKVITLDGTKLLKNIFRNALLKLETLRTRNESFFEQTFVISNQSAEIILSEGLSMMSHFNRMCPVYIFDNPQTIHNPFNIKGRNSFIYPVLHRSFIYFIYGKENLRKFRNNPLIYISNHNIHKYISYPLRIAIIGPPKSGKSTLTNKLAQTYGIIPISKGSAIRHIIENFYWTELGEKIIKVLQAGATLNLDVIIHAIQTMVLDYRTTTYGYVLDGFPETAAECKQLMNIGLHPLIVFHVKNSYNKIVANVKEEIYYEILKRYPPYSIPYIKNRLRYWKDDATKNCINNNLLNVITLNGNYSKWECWSECIHGIKEFIPKMYSYLSNLKISDKVIPAGVACISKDDFQRRMSIYKNLCPVCLQHNVIRHSDWPIDRQGVVQFKNKFYWICQKHMECVINNPRCMQQENTVEIPEIPAVIVNINKNSVHENGICIVTYAEHLPGKKLEKGHKELAAASRVPVPDDRYDYLCEYHKPASKVPAFLNVVDIAGLVKGAAEGQGLGNAFLSHIKACDAIFNLCRAFDDDDVIHVDGEVNPVRDLETIGEELRLKDEEQLIQNFEKLERVAGRGGDKKLKPEHDALTRIKAILVDEKKHIRFGDWSVADIEVLNKYLFLTSKPALYLVNLSEKDYIRKKNKWLPKLKEWIDKNDPGAPLIPFSGALESKLLEMEADERQAYLKEHGTTSALDKIIIQGYKALQLEYFFTAGADEVKAWTILKGTKAPQAAGRIHTDFEKGFIMAEVMHFKDFKEEGTEVACKSAGKYRQQGRNYVVEDGDIIFFKFNAGAGLKDPKKK